MKFYPYKLKLVHAMKPQDCPARAAFSTKLLDEIATDDQYLKKISFSDEATFHLSGAVNRHNVSIWGTENPKENVETELNSPTVNIWCWISNDKCYRTVCFADHKPRQLSENMHFPNCKETWIFYSNRMVLLPIGGFGTRAD